MSALSPRTRATRILLAISLMLTQTAFVIVVATSVAADPGKGQGKGAEQAAEAQTKQDAKDEEKAEKQESEDQGGEPAEEGSTGQGTDDGSTGAETESADAESGETETREPQAADDSSGGSRTSSRQPSTTTVEPRHPGCPTGTNFHILWEFTFADDGDPSTPETVSGCSDKAEVQVRADFAHTTHISCSDPFTGGYATSGSPDQSLGEPQILSYSINWFRFDNQGNEILHKQCGDTFAPPGTPELTVTKTPDAAVVDAGDPVGFTITVSSSGAVAATGVTLSDSLPAGGSGLTWTISPAVTGCSITGGTQLTCSFGDLDPGQSRSVHVVSSATTPDDCGSLNNTAVANSTNAGSANASASVSVQCPGINIFKTPDQGIVEAGESIGFTITVTNSGPGTATDVTLTDPLPTGSSGLTWSISPAVTGCSITGGSQLTCDFGNLAAGQSRSVHVVSSATDAADCGVVNNTATVTTSNAGSDDASASVEIECVPLPPAGDIALNVVKTNDADADGTFTDVEVAPDAGAGVDFRAVITNTSTVPVVIDSITDAFEGTTMDVCAALVGTTLQPAQSVICEFSLPDYAPDAGDSIVDTVTAEGHEEGDPTNTASDADDSTVLSPSAPPAITINVIKTNDADTDGSFTDVEVAPEPGADVAFQAVITNTSTVPVVIDAITDVFDGTTIAVCPGLVGTTLQPGQSITCSFTMSDYAPPEGDDLVNTVSVDAHEEADPANTATADDDSTVQATEVLAAPPAAPPAAAPADDAPLAATGTDVLPTVALAFALMLLGAGLVLADVKRGSAQAS